MSVLWAQVWQPALTSKRDSYAQLTKIDAIEGLLHSLPISVVPQEMPEPLRLRVTGTASEAGLEIRRLDPQGAALSVSLDKVPFAALISWVETLSTTAGVRVLAAEIGRLPEPGQVTARLLLENSL
ncbi:General secretion pathway protein M [Candidatus Rhodobacter oscarellae]|uniref:General secretion pathway protein M n=2 Tax=Candidatus Rhodobacter oscarellae TaxID=1675527 RepID=A0A0J9E9F0_9RHOB|nr:General secretion pathway protein M [Candidatus Rhodobacter lobularis]